MIGLLGKSQSPWTGTTDWFVPGQTYVRFELPEEGVYRVAVDSILQYAPVFSGASANLVQLYYLGQEVALYYEDVDGNGLFTGGDFFEFYCEGTDGRLEGDVYRSSDTTGRVAPELQSNPYYSLFSREAVHFITVGVAPGLRVTSLITQSSDVAGLTPEPYFRALSDSVSRNAYFGSISSGSDARYTLNADYVAGEGFGSGRYLTPTVITTSLQVPHAVAAPSEPPRLEFRYSGFSLGPHELRIEFGSSIVTESFTDIAVNTVEVAGNPADFSTGTIAVRTAPLLGSNDQVRHYFHRVFYDRYFRFTGVREADIHAWTPAGPGPHYLRLEGVNAPTGDAVILYDTETDTRVEGYATYQAAEGILDTTHFRLPPTAGTHRLYYVASSRRKLPLRYASIVGPSLHLPSNAAELVIVARKALEGSAQALANYRSANPYNQLSARVVLLDDIYMAFNYGQASPMAIKRFFYAAINDWSTPAQYAILWGKVNGTAGLRYELANPVVVPTWGEPASDIEYVSNFNPDRRNHVPVIPIGRVSLLSDEDGYAYVDKVIEYESSPFQDWMKKAVYLGGGYNADEQTQIQSIFEGLLRPIQEGPPSYGSVFYQQKVSSDVVDAGTSADIRNAINEGAGIITFIGHSSTNLFDVEIEPATSYTNYGRYPVMFANGCYSGNFVGASYTFGEQFVLEPGRGSIAYASRPSEGIISYMGLCLEQVTDVLLKNPGIRLGDAHRLGIEAFLAIGSNRTNPYGIQHAQQYNLLGDPSLKFYAAEGPDLIAEEGLTVQFEPESPTVQLDSFLVHVAVRNRGLYTSDSFNVSLRQTVTSTNTVLNYPTVRLLMTENNDTLTFSVKTGTVDMGGINAFEVILDPEGEIAEFDESNNRVVAEVDVVTDVPALIYPWPKAQLPVDTLTLQAALYNDRTHTALEYIFELDTTANFNSPLLQSSGPIAGTSYLGSWRVPGVLQRGTTYYWRSRVTTSDPDSWATGSFTLAWAGEGITYQQPAQFSENTLNDLLFEQANRRFTYPSAPIRIEVDNQPGSNFCFVNGTFIFGSDILFWGGGPQMVYTLFDPYSGEIIVPFTEQYGNALFMNPIDTNAIKTLLDTLRPGTGIMLMCSRSHNIDFATLSPEFKDLLRSIGASEQLLTHNRTYQFTLIGKKGLAPGEAAEALATTANQLLQLENSTLLTSRAGEGQLSTGLLGPAKAWHQLSWGWQTEDPDIGDDASLSLYAVRPNGQDSLLVSGLTSTSYDLSGLDATLFPFVRATATLNDLAYRTPPQPDSLVVTYDPAPELSLDALTDYTFSSSEMQEGQVGNLRIGVRNLSKLATDSTWLAFDLTSPQRPTEQVNLLRVPPLAPGQFVVLEDTFATVGHSGTTYLRASLNATRDSIVQLTERQAFNNRFVLPIEISGDGKNPLIDVLFDGRRIVNGDIVAPEPTITIQIRDDNPYLKLTDTSSVEVLLNPKDAVPIPGGGRVFYEPGRLEFQAPKADGKNVAQVVFTPDALEDGEYTLTVRGQDASQNLAGVEPFEVSFRVENQSRLTQIINYPNPFSTQTRWVYTLTGSVLPEVFQIHIYTVRGQLIKIIDLVELGQVAIGTVETTWAWDGTDDFGDPLANGVYLYRTVVKMPGEAPLELDGSQTAQYFKKGWGKLVILR